MSIPVRFQSRQPVVNIIRRQETHIRSLNNRHVSKNLNRRPMPPHSPFGFIMVRCITNALSSQYWFQSYNCIRKYYPDTPILIVDDNSNPRYVDKRKEDTLDMCAIVQSEHPKRGEILGYYYMYKKRCFDKAVILHDSVFMNNHVDFQKYNKVRFLWHFDNFHIYDIERASGFLRNVNPIYKRDSIWDGCFGVMSVIDLDFLDEISGMFFLLDDVNCRNDRMCMERIFAIICFHHHPQLIDNPSIMGNIFKFPSAYRYTFSDYKKGKNINRLPSIVKVWTGR